MLSPQFTNSCSHLQGGMQRLLKHSLKGSPRRHVLCTFLKRLDFLLRKFGIDLKIDGKAHLELDSLTSIFIYICWSWLTFLKFCWVLESVAISVFTFLDIPVTRRGQTYANPNSHFWGTKTCFYVIGLRQLTSIHLMLWGGFFFKRSKRKKKHWIGKKKHPGTLDFLLSILSETNKYNDKTPVFNPLHIINYLILITTLWNKVIVIVLIL